MNKIKELEQRYAQWKEDEKQRQMVRANVRAFFTYASYHCFWSFSLEWDERFQEFSHDWVKRGKVSLRTGVSYPRVFKRLFAWLMSSKIFFATENFWIGKKIRKGVIGSWNSGKLTLKMFFFHRDLTITGKLSRNSELNFTSLVCVFFNSNISIAQDEDENHDASNRQQQQQNDIQNIRKELHEEVSLFFLWEQTFSSCASSIWSQITFIFMKPRKKFTSSLFFVLSSIRITSFISLMLLNNVRHWNLKWKLCEANVKHDFGQNCNV